jgi:hypothetical protein
MKKIKSIGLNITLAATLGLTGCGGGGGSSSGNSSSSGNNSNLSFPSNAVSATPTIENGEKVKDVVAKNQKTAYSINSIDTPSSSKNVALVMQEITNVTNQINVQFYALNETINQTESCSDGGTISYSGSGSDTGGATITYTFNNCNEYGVILNGKFLAKMSNYNSTYDDYTTLNVTYLSDTTVSASGSTVKIYSGSTETLNFTNITGYGSANTLKMTLSAIEEVNSIISGQKDSVYYFDLSSSQPKMYQTAGKIYINNLDSYVDYDTSYDMSQTPFIFNYSGLESGEARYIMANGGKAKIIAESGQSKVYIDTDGDGIYELSE